MQFVFSSKRIIYDAGIADRGASMASPDSIDSVAIIGDSANHQNPSTEIQNEQMRVIKKLIRSQVSTCLSEELKSEIERAVTLRMKGKKLG